MMWSSRFRLRAAFGVGSAVLAAATVTAGTAPLPVAASGDDTPYTQPVAPPKCTQDQINSGDVGGCLLFGTNAGNHPDENGWGVVPSPGVGSGWTWGGYNYNGSAALAEHETRMATNSVALGSQQVGTFEMHADVKALFEGFLAELAAGGYSIRHASGYSFRCTGTWSCPSGDVDDLSLHAWGLAFDMNSDANPIRSYSGQNGQSACLTPMVTDLPEWAIRTAERWGIYWGGYGWNSGCNVAGAQRTSVTRDAPHFEFRGSPAQARVIAQFNYANNPGLTCFGAVADDGTSAERCTLAGRPEALWRLPVTTTPPAGATAALVNLTATDATAPGYLTLESCGAQPAGPRSTSSLTYAAGEAVATLAIVPLDADGRFCIYRASAVHSVVDVLGFLVDADDAGTRARWLDPATPTRVLDTRTTGTPVAARSEVPVPELDGDMLVNLAAAPAGAAGYLQAGACTTLGPDAGFSNVNYANTAPRSNLALVRAGNADACVFTLAAADVIVDALATLSPTTGFGWSVAEPRRVLDTRERTAGRPAAGELIELDLGTADPAAVVALTVTAGTAAGYLSVGTCANLREQLTSGVPATSNLNHAAGQTVTNLATVALDDGRMCVYTKSPTHVIVDVQATLSDAREVALVPVDPLRVHDSRES